MESLREMTRAALAQRFGIDMNTDNKSVEIGQQPGVTDERIRQIELKALRKLVYPRHSQTDDGSGTEPSDRDPDTGSS
jgi:RNA polymerase primary sigma factor